MGEAEKRLATSEPIRNDILRLQEDIISKLNIDGITWQRGIGTTHLRGCMQGLKALAESHPKIENILKGRHVHFGNQTGISLNGSIILSTSEVRDQWLQLISRAENLDVKIQRIPFMQKAVSNSLRNIEITQRKYQPFLLAESYCDNLMRLVTALGDFLGKTGFPPNWPKMFYTTALFIHSAAGPLMLSPTGQIIAPSSCPPWLLVNFISENMDEAYKRISEYKRLVLKTLELVGTLLGWSRVFEKYESLPNFC
ncbi:T-cell activation inhibitor, mitochondrial [Armadillidium vulgare]|nr:T-cell activation inhibitor, mitochondrial [Armadillidium vulgare]